MSVPCQTSPTETSLVHDLKANLLEQQKANAMLLHDKETAVMERDLLREEVLRLFRDGNRDTTLTTIPPLPPSLPPPPISISSTSMSSNEDTGESDVNNLLEKLKLAVGGQKIREEGTKLVNHLRGKIRERKRAKLQAEDEREYAVVQLRSIEINLKAKESGFLKEIEDLSEEVLRYGFNSYEFCNVQETCNIIALIYKGSTIMLIHYRHRRDRGGSAPLAKMLAHSANT